MQLVHSPLKCGDPAHVRPDGCELLGDESLEDYWATDALLLLTADNAPRSTSNDWSPHKPEFRRHNRPPQARVITAQKSIARPLAATHPRKPVVAPGRAATSKPDLRALHAPPDPAPRHFRFFPSLNVELMIQGMQAEILGNQLFVFSKSTAAGLSTIPAGFPMPSASPVPSLGWTFPVVNPLLQPRSRAASDYLGDFMGLREVSALGKGR
jgi:hypothetical protein